MKKLVLSLVAVSLFSVAQPALANISVLVKGASVEGNFMPPIPPGMKPVTNFEIEVEFCRHVAARDIRPVVKQLAQGVYSVEFTYRGADCAGPTHRQTLDVSTTAIPLHSRVVVKNALLLEDRTSH